MVLDRWLNRNKITCPTREKFFSVFGNGREGTRKEDTKQILAYYDEAVRYVRQEQQEAARWAEKARVEAARQIEIAHMEAVQAAQILAAQHQRRVDRRKTRQEAAISRSRANQGSVAPAKISTPIIKPANSRIAYSTSSSPPTRDTIPVRSVKLEQVHTEWNDLLKKTSREPSISHTFSPKMSPIRQENHSFSKSPSYKTSSTNNLPVRPVARNNLPPAAHYAVQRMAEYNLSTEMEVDIIATGVAATNTEFHKSPARYRDRIASTPIIHNTPAHIKPASSQARSMSMSAFGSVTPQKSRPTVGVAPPNCTPPSTSKSTRLERDNSAILELDRRTQSPREDNAPVLKRFVSNHRTEHQSTSSYQSPPALRLSERKRAEARIPHSVESRGGSSILELGIPGSEDEHNTIWRDRDNAILLGQTGGPVRSVIRGTAVAQHCNTSSRDQNYREDFGRGDVYAGGHGGHRTERLEGDIKRGRRAEQFGNHRNAPRSFDHVRERDYRGFERGGFGH